MFRVMTDSFSDHVLRLVRLMLLALLVVVPEKALADGQRMALVVGNGNYVHLDPLPNATRDARDIAAALQRQGFDVTLALDSAFDDLRRTLEQFAQAAAGAEAVLFYFSGHGFQKSGVNYLAPVDAVLDKVDLVADQTLRLDGITDRLSAVGRHSIILLDACRNNPLLESLGADMPAGLAVPETGRDTFVAFATQPGNLTYDGREGQNSPFTRALLRHIGTEGQPISELMIEVRNEVEAVTMGQQIPWDQSSLTAPFFFNPLRPTAEEFEALAMMPDTMRERILRTWRAQGVQIPADGTGVIELSKAASDSMQINPNDSTASTPGASSSGFGFDLIILEDEPLPAPGLSEGTITLAALPEPAPRDIGVARALQQLSATEVLATARSPFIPDTPIAWLAALDPDLRSLDSRASLPRIRGEDVTPPELNLPEMTDAELAAAVQTELQRVGCYRMRIDGDWGNGSRGALRQYLERTGQRAEGVEPTPAILLMVRASTDVVCPSPEPVVRNQQQRQQQQAAPQQRQQAAPQQQPAQPAQSNPTNADRLRNAIERGRF